MFNWAAIMPVFDNFWSWALQRWQDGDLARALLALQEEQDVVVLEVMLLAWLGREGWLIDEEGHRKLVAAGRPWVRGVVVPLRNTRQAWRGDDSLNPQRGRLQRLELQAEAELGRLYFETLAELRLDVADGHPSDSLAANIRHTLDGCAGGNMDASRLTLVELLSR
ncbi:MAG: DUF2390 domain-containing protein [Cellvibrionales bacterium]|jgi:uncharacterized protein (TIGR02444 family)